VNVNPLPGWNIIIDLGDYYELSRIITHQRWCNLERPSDMKYDMIGYFYGLTNVNVNVGIYNIYWWDGDDLAQTGEWKLIQQVKIPMPESDMATLDVIRQAVAGNEALMYPNDPDYTPATRYFRYQAVRGFTNNYTGHGDSLSELTLYGRKATK
jgi:hypothetical protein